MTPIQIQPDNCPPKKNIRVYFNAVKAITALYPENIEKHAVNDDVEDSWMGDGSTGITLKHVSNLSNMSMCCNSWKRVGLINMKRAAGLVTPAKFNYSD